MALSSTSTAHTLNHTTLFQEGQKRRFPHLDLQKKILNSSPLPHSLINTRNTKRQNHGFPHHPHFLWSQVKRRVTHETNNWPVVHKSWMERCLRHTLGFIRGNLQKYYLQKKKLFLMAYRQDLTHL